ncbi:hypothetical protein EYF80_027941 [Liparis tanakae]|uniref:Uncharacterized protein n=1 Tax=Liparis tanakae TaxID=230148 RepID=A0A4Z2HAB1_9TELE|nr:hypothetical protein EYF80_027941 [Liparis tanakae]
MNAQGTSERGGRDRTAAHREGTSSGERRRRKKRKQGRRNAAEKRKELTEEKMMFRLPELNKRHFSVSESPSFVSSQLLLQSGATQQSSPHYGMEQRKRGITMTMPKSPILVPPDLAPQQHTQPLGQRPCTKDIFKGFGKYLSHSSLHAGHLTEGQNVGRDHGESSGAHVQSNPPTNPKPHSLAVFRKIENIGAAWSRSRQETRGPDLQLVYAAKWPATSDQRAAFASAAPSLSLPFRACLCAHVLSRLGGER